ncbi:hypothetical protein LMH73_023855 [Vibrio splendidus]|nr:hypothetical protein [Vibrio splendidus]MCC4883078.1 hypothetical protein [Vibrio splendidus]
MKKLLLIVGLLTLSGCATIDKTIDTVSSEDFSFKESATEVITTNPESVKKKVANALGTTPNKVIVKNEKRSFLKVNFDVAYNKRAYQCYYTGAAALTSDVICTAADGKAMPKEASCNALLKAAKKC